MCSRIFYDARGDKGCHGDFKNHVIGALSETARRATLWEPAGLLAPLLLPPGRGGWPRNQADCTGMCFTASRSAFGISMRNTPSRYTATPCAACTRAGSAR